MKTHIQNIASILVRITGILLAIITFGLIIKVLLFFAGQLDLADFLFAKIGDHLLVDVIITILFLLFTPLFVFYMWERDFSIILHPQLVLLPLANIVAVMIWWQMEKGALEIAVAFIFIIMIGFFNLIATFAQAFYPFKKSTQQIPK